MKFLVVERHRSSRLEQIAFEKGALLIVEEKHPNSAISGSLFCSTQDDQNGWVPGQVVEFVGGGYARAIADYSSAELDVDPSDILLGLRQLNGRTWCRKPSNSATGWVPSSCLEVLQD